MQFCPKCGSLMFPRRKEGVLVLVCRRCGFEKPASGNVAGSVTTRRNVNAGRKKILVIEGDVGLQTLPKVKTTCPKCGHDEAYFWTLQTRSADEPATRFFKCVKCGYSWREYD